jgi:hypothetical protein
MQKFKVAHIHEKGEDLIIVPLEQSYGTKPNSEQNGIRNSLQKCAIAAKLAGTVVPVWDNGKGRMGFLAPTRLAAYFSSISLDFVVANLNKTIPSD